VHSHTAEYPRFSPIDDESDRSVFTAVANFLGDDLPHASAIMLPNGELFGRVLQDGIVSIKLSLVSAAGDDLGLWGNTTPAGSFALRHEQAFGRGTTGLLRS